MNVKVKHVVRGSRFFVHFTFCIFSYFRFLRMYCKSYRKLVPGRLTEDLISSSLSTTLSSFSGQLFILGFHLKSFLVTLSVTFLLKSWGISYGKMRKGNGAFKSHVSDQEMRLRIFYPYPVDTLTLRFSSLCTEGI